MSVNLYDFDHTVYKGDASLDFIIFCLKRHPRLWKYIPSQAIALVGYVFGRKTRKEIKQVAFRFLQDVENLEYELSLFWDRNEPKIMTWYKNQADKTDVFASASPEFLLTPIFKRLGIEKFVATRMNEQTGDIDGENCRAEEKVARLSEAGILREFEGAYSDSLSDIPILKLAKQGYITRKGRTLKLEDYKPSKLSRLKSPDFMRFLFVGGVNALLGISLAYSASLFIENAVAAFTVGYAVSLVPSYYLNSLIVFKDSIFSLRKFIKFVISYVPNFAIQLIAVNIFIDIFGLSPLLTYTAAVVVAVPVTFLLLAFFTFTKNK